MKLGDFISKTAKIEKFGQNWANLGFFPKRDFLNITLIRFFLQK